MIESRHNEKIKAVRALRTRRARDESDLLLIEGRREIELAVRNNVDIRSVFYCPDMMRHGDDFDTLKTIDKNGAARTHACSRPVYSTIAYRESTEPFVAVAHRKKTALNELSLPEKPLLLVAEAVEKPGNLGGIFRTADAAGVDAVIVCDPRTDINNPNVVRSSLGAVFSVCTVTASAEDTLAFLKKNKIRIFAAAPDSGTDYTNADMSGAAAIIVGSENKGLNSAWLAGDVVGIRIPMRGMTDSLNVSVSAAVILFEARRQRHARLTT